MMKRTLVIVTALLVLGYGTAFAQTVVVESSPFEPARDMWVNGGDCKASCCFATPTIFRKRRKQRQSLGRKIIGATLGPDFFNRPRCPTDY